MSRPKQKRKQVYVSREIQGRVVSKLAIYWATYHLALWHVMFLFHYFLYRGQVLANPQMVPVPFPVQYFQFLTQHYSMLVCAAAVFPLIFWDMMKVTHRIAGPLVRFTNTLEQLKRGEKVSRIQLRKGDHLTDFQDAFNSYLETAGLLQQDEAARAWQTDKEPAATANIESGNAESLVLSELDRLSDSLAGEELAPNEDADPSESLEPAGANS